MKKILLYTDGGFKDGASASAAIVKISNFKKIKIVAKTDFASAIEAEIFAGILGIAVTQKILANNLFSISSSSIEQVIWYCDNKVVVDIANDSLKNWSQNGWQTKQNKEIAHLELWQELWRLTKNIPNFSTAYVQAHSTVRENINADKACRWIIEKGERLLLEFGEGYVGKQSDIKKTDAWVLVDARKRNLKKLCDIAAKSLL